MKLRNRKVVLLALLAMVLDAFPQSWESIRDNEEYIYGQGFGKTVDEADKQALSYLASQIWSNVSSEFIQTLIGSNNNGKLDEQSQFTHTINTSSQARLTNAQQIILTRQPEACVVRWVKKAEVDRMFEARKRKAIDYVLSAQRAEVQGKADDVLWNYYSALTLLNSLQYPNDVMFPDATGQNRVLTTLIKERMDETFDQLHAVCERMEENMVTLRITYKGKPVNTVNYSYWDGRDWTPHNGAKDGCGVAELIPSYDTKEIKIRWEVKHVAASNSDPELRALLAGEPDTPMPKSQTVIALKPRKLRKKAQQQVESFTTNSKEMLKVPTPMGDEAKQYMPIVNKMIDAIQLRHYDAVKNLFTVAGWDMFHKLIKYGHARVLDSKDIRFYETEENVVGRGLMMSFSFDNSVKKTFVEDIVLTFNDDKRIDNIAFGLGRTAEDDILNKGAWKEDSRFAIMNFLENYKTAYALKRLDYIRSVFDDDAVIFIGRMVSRASKTVNMENRAKISQEGNKILQRNRLTKDEYLKRLEACFKRNEFINIHFADNRVRKLGKGGESYAIEIAQDYYSSTYGDKGYLMLMVDINDPERPLIKLRTWQPEKDPQFGLYTPGDF